ncbi:PPE domain-containing protein [Lentzea terrae]|uniref:PPE domain-containing protein n=1 Tax=Lentzea terrae TaxID=2200761 RepID=UPI000DD45481|nr:PPE domain-containing protein [Lentzea terrae]
MSHGSHDNKGNGNSGGKDDKSQHGNGYDRDKIHEPIDWMTFSHEKLYNMVHTGVNLEGAQAAATNWKKIGDDIAAVRENLLKAVEDSAVGWDSESARLAREGLTEVTNWVDDTSTYAHKVSDAIATERDNVEAARAAMPPPPKAPEPPVPVEETPVSRVLLRDRLAMVDRADTFGGVQSLHEPVRVSEFSGFERLGTSPVDTLAANDAQHRLAADVMAAFQRNSAAVDQTVPAQFTPPVNPVYPNPPTLGGSGDLSGRTPGDSGGVTGGATGGPVTTTTGAQNRGATNTSSRGFGAGVRGGGGGFTGGMMPGRFGQNANQGGPGGGGGAGGGGSAGLSAGVNERAGAGAAAAAASSAPGGQTRAFQNPLAMGGAPMAAGAPAAGQGRGDEREHKSASYLEEDDNVFGLDRKAAPPVIGQ